MKSSKFFFRNSDERWPIKRSGNYVGQTLRDCYKKLCTTWLQAQPKFTCNGVSETPAKVEARVLEHMKRCIKHSQQTTHCHNVGDPCGSMMSYSQALVLEILLQGSSCRSHCGTQGRNQWWRVKQLHAPDNLASTQAPVQGLSVDCYDSPWITGLTQCQIEDLEMAEEKFIWMKVTMAWKTRVRFLLFCWLHSTWQASHRCHCPTLHTAQCTWLHDDIVLTWL